MNNSNIYFLILLLLVIINPLFAQNNNGHNEGSDHEKIHHHTIAMFVGYSLISNETSSDDGQTFVAPTLGLDYFYKFNHKFGLGFLNDIELASYEVETGHEESLKREYAFVSTLVFTFEPISWWSVFAGPGFEFEHHESFFVTRLGTEFIKKFNDGWSLAATFTVDIKELNTTPAFGITIFKGLGKSK